MRVVRILPTKTVGVGKVLAIKECKVCGLGGSEVRAARKSKMKGKGSNGVG